MRPHSVLVFLVTMAVSCCAALASTPAHAPLEDEALERVVAATKLISIIEHFHPTDQAASADWLAVTADAMERAEAAASPEALAEAMRGILGPIAPTMRIWTDDEDKPSPVFVRAEGSPIVALLLWRHFGYGAENAKGLYRRVRFALTANRLDKLGPMPDPSRPMTFDLGGGIHAMAPVTVWIDQEARTVPLVEGVYEPKRNRERLDRAQRLAGVARLWGVFQHFAPFAEPDTDTLESMLRSSLAEAATAQGEDDYVRVLEKMLAPIPDGRARLIRADAPCTRRPSIEFGIIDERRIVAFSSAPSGLVRAGDEVVLLGDRDAGEALRESQRYVSGVDGGSLRLRALDRLLCGPEGTSLGVTIRGADGAEREVTLARTAEVGDSLLRKPASPWEAAPGVYYIDPSRHSPADLIPTLRALGEIKGLIVDHRGLRTSGMEQAIGIFLGGDVAYQRAAILQPIPQMPNREVVGGNRRSDPIIGIDPPIETRVVFLADGRTLGSAESDLVLVRAGEIGQIVGATTGGGIGELTRVELPGGMVAEFIGVAAFDERRQPINGVGIQPDVHVEPTIESLRAGRDVVIAEALRILLNDPQSE